jgi:hypothetical protein
MLGIDWLFSPYDKNVFFEEIWQKRPEVLATGRAGYFEGVFSKEEVERIIEFAQLRPPLIKLGSASSDEWTEVPFSPNGRIDIDQLRKIYLQGDTVILNKVEDFSPAIARLARAIETEMGARVQVNSYLTPPSAQAFPHTMTPMTSSLHKSKARSYGRYMAVIPCARSTRWMTAMNRT